MVFYCDVPGGGLGSGCSLRARGRATLIIVPVGLAFVISTVPPCASVNRSGGAIP